MKKLLWILALVVSLGACDKCRKIACENEQSCDDGTCACSQWFIGEQCEAVAVRQYVGTYEGDFSCEGSGGDDQLELLPTDLTNVLLMEMSGSEVEMLFSDIHHFEITPETIGSPIGDYIISGDGHIVGKELAMELHYQLREGNTSLNCTVDMSR